MDNLTLAILPWGLGLTLFSALRAAEWLSARRHRRRMELRLTELARTELTRSPDDNLARTPHNGHNPYSLTWPATRTRPWQRRVR